MTNSARHILSMSGGKDSTALALYMRDRIPDMEYVFCDTDKELTETYEYLNRVEAFLGKKIVRLNSKRGFDHWLDVFGGYLPSPSMRWCTKMLKLRPFEEYVGKNPVISYVGLRADEDRVGYISTKSNIKAVFPFKEDGIDYAGVMKILEDSGIGLPPYLKWGRTHSGCYFCFFQRSIEWVRLLETHPEQFEQAMQYEKLSNKPGKKFTWNQEMPLSELRKPENVAAIKLRFAEHEERMRKNRGNQKLVQILADMEDDDDEPRACLICQLWDLMNLDKIYEIKLKEIDISTANVRHSDPEIELDELVDSIKKHGLLQPVVLLGEHGEPRYSLISGQRRYLAHERLGKEKIRAVFAGKLNKTQAVVRSLVENLQRVELDYADTARAITELYKEFGRDERRVKQETGLSIKKIREYIQIDVQATRKIKTRLQSGKIKPADVKRALRAAQGDSEKAEEIVDLIIELKPTRHQKNRIALYGEQSKSSSAKHIMQEAMKPHIEETIIISLSDDVRKALARATKKLSMEAEDLASKVLSDWLNAQGFFR